MRLAMIWKGKFADPAGVWSSQGHGRVRPIGGSRIEFSVGPELDDAESQWIVDEGRPPQHRFKGYTLDDKQRPAFLYRVDGVMVEDYLVDVPDSDANQSFIRRTLTLQADQPWPLMMFRAAEGKTIINEGNGVFLIDGTLRIRVDDQHTGEVVTAAEGKRLRIPIDGSVSASKLILDYIW